MKEQNNQTNEQKRLTEEEIMARLEAHQHYLLRNVEGWKQMCADFSNCDLSGVNFPKFAKKISPNGPFDLSDAIFFGANLSDSDLSDTVLNSCDFRKANLSHAHLENVSCCGAYFSAASAWMCNCTCAKFYSCDFVRADFQQACINKANFKACNFIEANFSQAYTELGADFINCKGIRTLFCGANLGDSDLSKSDFSGAVFSDVNLSNATMNNVIANNASFVGALMEFITANNSAFRQVDFTGANLYASKFERCDFYDSIFQWTNLTKTDLSGSHIDLPDHETSYAGSEEVAFQWKMLPRVEQKAKQLKSLNKNR